MQNTNMENDIAIFRLADVYVKAEALVRMGGDLGEATRLVNATGKGLTAIPTIITRA